MATTKRKPGMTQREFEEAAYPLTLSGMADYAQEWMDQYKPGENWPTKLENACSAAWREECGQKNQVTPELRRFLADWFSNHY